MKCSSPYHPHEYLKYSRDELSKHLPSANENDTGEVNILLLGETGVGKSTFINGLINYLTYATFDEAMSGDLKVAIPCQFAVSDDDYEVKLIKMGNSSNECEIVGQSATQQAKAHFGV
jgi:predicted GTPase